MLVCAFPDDVSEEDYWILLALLRTSDMSFRAISSVVSQVSDKNYYVIYNDISGIAEDSIAKKHQQEFEAMKEKLKPCGYDVWFEELNKF
jgi:hypothetical protein